MAKFVQIDLHVDAYNNPMAAAIDENGDAFLIDGNGTVRPWAKHPEVTAAEQAAATKAAAKAAAEKAAAEKAAAKPAPAATGSAK